MKNPLVTAIAAMIVCSSMAQSDSANYFFQKGNQELSARRYLPAYKAYQRSVEFNAENAAAQKGLGKSAMELRKYEDARKAYSKLLQLHKDDTAAISSLKKIYFWTRKWDEAVTYAQKAQQLKLGKDNNYIIAKAFYEQENYGKAMDYLELAYKDDAKNPEVPYLAARSLVEMSNYKQAAGCFEQAIALDSTKSNWMYEAGLTYYAIPDDAKAVYWLERAAVKGYKRTNDYLHNLANAYLSIKQYDKGLALLYELLDRKPQDVDVAYTIGDAYYNIKKYDQAIEMWTRILTVDNKNSNALYMMGMAFQKKGEKEKGQALCDRAIAMDPGLAKLKQEKKMPGM